MLIAANADVNAATKRGITPLMYFAFFTHSDEEIQILKALLEAHADVHAQNEGALRHAIGGTSPKAVQLLLDAGANPNPTFDPKSNSDTPLTSATSCRYENCPGSLEMVKLLVAKQADINGQGALSRTALDAAGSSGNIEVVRFLLGLNPSLSGRIGESALGLAARRGATDLVKTLLERGVSPDVPSQSPPALHEAAGYGHVEVVNLLIAHHATVNLPGPYNGLTALMYASGANTELAPREASEAITRALLAAHANVDQGAKYGETALITAARRNAAWNIPILLAAGADKNYRDRRHMTAADHAREVSSPDFVYYSTKGYDPDRSGVLEALSK